MATFLAKCGMDRDELAREYLQTVAQAGFKGNALPAKEVEVLDSIQLKCQIPLCESYGERRVCPPHLPPLETFRRALLDYETVFVLSMEVAVAEIRGHEPELRLDDFVRQSEGWALGKGCYWAFGLGGGSCYRCKSCNMSIPCPHPFLPRPSPEGLGIDITHLSRAAGYPINWPPGERVNYFGLFFL